MAFDLKYLGHSGFEINILDKSILIDPFLSVNNEYDYREKNITDIFITHGHSDHIGNSIDIAKNKKAMITTIVELANYCSQKGAKANGINFGSWIDYEWCKFIFVPAIHTSSAIDGTYTGEPAGIIFDINGIKIYHAGDTALFSDMKIIKELYNPDIAMLPIGGFYTMDIEHAAIAAEWINAKITIPIHYNTFNTINADVHKFEMLLSTKNLQCTIMKINEEISF